MNQKSVLLATIEAALEMQSPAGPLSADGLTRLGRQLGLSNERTRELVIQLSEDRKIELEWGGVVKGVPRESGTPSIYLGENATFVGQGARVHQSAVGAKAKVRVAPRHPSTSPDQLTPIVAVLTVSLDKLTSELNSMTQAQQELCGQLIPLVEAMQKQLLNKDGTDKGSIADKLEEASGLIEKAGKLGTAAAPYLPRLIEALHHAAQYVSAIPGLPL